MKENTQRFAFAPLYKKLTPSAKKFYSNLLEMEPNWDLAFALDDPIHHYSHSHYLRSSSHNPSHMGRSYGNKNVWPPASALASITEDVRDLQGAWPPIPSIDNLDSPSAAAGDDDEQAVEFNGPGLLVMISFFFLFL